MSVSTLKLDSSGDVVLRYVALVPAAGSGARMAGYGGGVPKQYIDLAGKPMIWHALATLCAVACIERVYVVLSPDDQGWQPAEFASLSAKLVVLRCGGETRAQSVSNGLAVLEQDFSGPSHDAVSGEPSVRVLVHDAARPCLELGQVETLIREVGAAQSGGLLAVPVADTLKRAERCSENATLSVAATVSRDGLWQAQTPQLFPCDVLRKALALAPQVTDEASAVEVLGLHPLLVAADSTNFKVTYPSDLALATLILRARESLLD